MTGKIPFSPDAVPQIQPSDLNNFYCSASDFDKSNIFFMLLAPLHHYEALNDNDRTAHLSYLTVCYLFIVLTPPGSCSLALYYIRKAIVLNPCDEYQEWLSLIKKGN